MESGSNSINGSMGGYPFPMPNLSYSEGSVLSLESRSSGSSTSQRRDKLIEARFARKKIERQAQKMIADAIDDELLAEELVASAELEEKVHDDGFLVKSATKEQRLPWNRRESRPVRSPGDNDAILPERPLINQQIDLITNVIAQQSLDSVVIEKFEGDPVDYA